MEIRTKNIFYLTTGTLTEKEAEGTEGRFSFFKRKEPVIRKCSRKFLYAKGRSSAAGNPVAGGAVQIYFTVFPEHMTEEMGKQKSRKKWLSQIEKVLEYAKAGLGCTDEETILFSKTLAAALKREQHIPKELYAVFLWGCKRKENFRQMLLSLPEEYGFLTMETVKELTEPYLAGVNRIVFTGEETENARELEDFFYREYGIIMEYSAENTADLIHLDLASGEEILKFLDTTVKSGYNTEVNYCVQCTKDTFFNKKDGRANSNGRKEKHTYL